MDLLQKMFDKYVDKTLEFRRIKCRELVATSHLNAVISLCVLLDTFATTEYGVSYHCCGFRRGGIMNIVKCTCKKEKLCYFVYLLICACVCGCGR